MREHLNALAAAALVMGILVALVIGTLLTPNEVICADDAPRWSESIGVEHIQCGPIMVTILD